VEVGRRSALITKPLQPGHAERDRARRARIISGAALRDIPGHDPRSRAPRVPSGSVASAGLLAKSERDLAYSNLLGLAVPRDHTPVVRGDLTAI
jgi:hypothetical protein